MHQSRVIRDTLTLQINSKKDKAAGVVLCSILRKIKRWFREMGVEAKWIRQTMRLERFTNPSEGQSPWVDYIHIHAFTDN